MAAIGAVAGGVLSYMGAQKQANAAKGGGKVDITHTVTPYGQGSQYMDAGAAAAYRALYGNQPDLLFDRNPNTPFGTPGTPNPGTGTPYGTTGVKPGTGAGGGDLPRNGDPHLQHDESRSGPAVPPGGQRRPDGRIVNAAGKTIYTPPAPRAPKGGKKATGGSTGGARQVPAAPFRGQSPETARAVENAMRVAGTMENSGTVQAANRYTQETLAGNDQNAYRGEAADYLRSLDDNPDYRRYLDSLFASDTGLGGGGGGGGVLTAKAARMYRPAVSAADAGGDGPTGAARSIRSILAGEDTPGAQAMRDRIRHQADDAYNEQVRQRRLEAAGSGMYGGTGQLTDEAFAQGRYGTGMADALAQQDYALYQEALGLGAQYDTSALDRAARMNAESSASMSAGMAQQNELASRERLARLDALGGAVGMGMQNRQFQAGGFGSLGSDFGASQADALGKAGDVNGMGQAGWLSAGGLSLGSDQARNSWQASQNQLSAANAATNVDRSRLAFDQQRYQHDLPMNDVAQYLALINGTYSPYSTTREYGVDQRSGSPALPNTGQQVLAGAAAGASLGSNWSR